ncbi:MAG: hypothetical protein K8U57_40770 [Planctomycetes bacterium]|nr:hypothetical protein [Planctomycetota bacterium]
MSHPENPTVRVAVVQAAPILFDTPRTLQKLADLAADAAQKGAELVVFPEAFVGGYPKGHDFGVSLGIRSPKGRDEFRRYFESVIEIPGPGAESIGAVARDHGIHLVVGVIEREGGTLYCSSVLFGSDGTLLGKHRKLMPSAMERVIWGSGDGSTIPVMSTKLGRIGSVICWENYMPLLRTAMYAMHREKRSSNCDSELQNKTRQSGGSMPPVERQLRYFLFLMRMEKPPVKNPAAGKGFQGRGR